MPPPQDSTQLLGHRRLLLSDSVILSGVLALAHVPVLSLESRAQTPLLGHTSVIFLILLLSFLLPDVENPFLVVVKVDREGLLLLLSNIAMILSSF